MHRILVIGLATLLAVACGKTESDAASAGDGGSSNPWASGPPDENGCCPRDATQSGCMNLGGHTDDANGCFRSCDFWCSTNWRVEKDAHGCEHWSYDKRSPKDGEDSTCIARAKPDAGSDADADADASNDASSDADAD